MAKPFSRSKIYPWLGLVAFVPLAVNSLTHTMRIDLLTIGTGINTVQELENEERRTDGILFQLQGLASVDEGKLVATSGEMVAKCRQQMKAKWYESSDLRQLRADLKSYCDTLSSRDADIQTLREQTHALKAKFNNVSMIVTSLDGDPREHQVESLERELRAFLVDPTPDEATAVRSIIKSMNGARYAAFKSSVEDILALSLGRYDTLQKAVDIKIYDVAEKARQAHIKACVDQDDINRESRRNFLVISLLLAIVTTITVWKIAMSNRRLEDFNQSLEGKVEKRTAELSEALDQLHEQQAALAQSAKMSALGEMAGGIAHEINTPLAAISLHAELLSGRATDDQELADGLATIVTITEKISKIVRGLKRFARMDADVVHSDVKITDVLDDTLLLCGEKMKFNGVKLDVVRNDNDATISCSREQVTQVLINLLNNAVNAVENLPQKWVRIETDVKDGVFTLKVVDGGLPISQHVREKMMQPFFTTKGVGKGNGLGLSISKKIIHAHDGTLEFDGAAVQTTFVMTLPSVTDEATPAVSAEKSEPHQRSA